MIYTIPGTYGSHRTPCNVICAELPDGRTWYVVEGSRNVNLSPTPLAPGVDVEAINDIDAFTTTAAISTPEALAAAIKEA